MTLRINDMAEGRIYVSPSGRLCKLVEYRRSGHYQGMLFFSYLSKGGNRTTEDGFRLSEDNAQALAAMREAPVLGAKGSKPVGWM